MNGECKKEKCDNCGQCKKKDKSLQDKFMELWEQPPPLPRHDYITPYGGKGGL